MALNFNKAEFVRSAGTQRDFLRDGLPQFAFAGRSNVGKSSVINRLVGRRNMAYVGASPGKTTQVNYFLIDRRAYLVDLPGYGYARVSKAERDRWGRLMESYFASGLITIGSHTYDMHQWPPLEPEGAALRENALPLPGESEADYAAAYTADIARSTAELEAETGAPCLALAYPYGRSAEQTWALTEALGIPITFSTEPKGNTLVKGLPQSLLNLGRFTIDDISAADLLALIA